VAAEFGDGLVADDIIAGLAETVETYSQYGDFLHVSYSSRIC
jgi:hypothetical protein